MIRKMEKQHYTNGAAHDEIEYINDVDAEHTTEVKQVDDSKNSDTIPKWFYGLVGFIIAIAPSIWWASGVSSDVKYAQAEIVKMQATMEKQNESYRSDLYSCVAWMTAVKTDLAKKGVDSPDLPKLKTLEGK